jgi:4-hydroxy-tetrahydrodipicolinate synthase
MSEPQFGRLLTAMVTPFDSDGDIHLGHALSVADHLIQTGSDTLVVAGTTGESPTLTFEEEERLFEAVIQHCKGRAQIMAGTGSNDTASAVRMTQCAEKLGATSSLQVVPYYNRPSQEGIYQHFKAIAESTSLPILLYNIPGRTGRNMEPETMARLSEIPTIVGVKESAGSIDQVKAIRAVVPDSFLIYSGDDGLTLPFMEAGACGVVSVASHCVGLQIKAMMQAYVENRLDEAWRIHHALEPLFEALFITSNPAPVKAALEMMGFDVGGLRLPLVPVTPQEKQHVKEALIQCGVL